MSQFSQSLMSLVPPVQDLLFIQLSLAFALFIMLGPAKLVEPILHFGDPEYANRVAPVIQQDHEQVHEQDQAQLEDCKQCMLAALEWIEQHFGCVAAFQAEQTADPEYIKTYMLDHGYPG